jgi:hypothetical protein
MFSHIFLSLSSKCRVDISVTPQFLPYTFKVVMYWSCYCSKQVHGEPKAFRRLHFKTHPFPTRSPYLVWIQETVHNPYPQIRLSRVFTQILVVSFNFVICIPLELASHSLCSTATQQIPHIADKIFPGNLRYRHKVSKDQIKFLHGCWLKFVSGM